MTFHPFRIDLREGRLWRGADAIDLKPKAFAVLAHLAARAGRLVTFEDLTAEIWRGTFVSLATMRSTVREVRRALGDRPRSPRFIDTVHGRGYRFIAPTLGSRDGTETSHDAGTAPAPEPLAGRSQELERLNDEFAIASSGRRRLVLLAGEPGVGKSALVEEFLRGVRTRGEAVSAFGFCISGHGPIEPYLPILEALERLCRGPRGRRQQDLLESFAPTWMLELPGLVDPETTRRLRVDAVRVDRDLMLLELAHAIEALCTEEPLVLVLEDLHWSDPASLGAIELLARRTERARLLVIGTHRPLPADSSLEKAKRLRTLRAERSLSMRMRQSPLEFSVVLAVSRS